MLKKDAREITGTDDMAELLCNYRQFEKSYKPQAPSSKLQAPSPKRQAPGSADPHKVSRRKKQGA